jgi:putative flippase GtrA
MTELSRAPVADLPEPGADEPRRPRLARLRPARLGELRLPAGLQRSAPGRLVLALLRDRRVRYVIVGGIAAGVYYVPFAAIWLLSGGRVPYLVDAVISNFICAVLTFPLYRGGVFGSNAPLLSSFLRFYLVCLWSLVFTLVGLPLLVEVAGVPVLLAQAILIVLNPLINYQVNKFWTFRSR